MTIWGRMKRVRHRRLRLLVPNLPGLHKRKRNRRVEQQAKVQMQRMARAPQMKMMTTMVQTERMKIAMMKAKTPSRKR